MFSNRLYIIEMYPYTLNIIEGKGWAYPYNSRRQVEPFQKLIPFTYSALADVSRKVGAGGLLSENKRLLLQPVQPERDLGKGLVRARGHKKAAFACC
ncbi:hypothetical protein, partial [Pontibacter vulgaris]|uniref:hypothetical protein n=1 Tax=Pontibacter vulgaris TaxID=2905679 RepID=UPI001FA789BB